jgi:hypothetical protein
VLYFGIQGCRASLWSHVAPVPLEEVDVHGVSFDRARDLRPGDRAESVERLLGEPADRRPSCVPGEIVWRYPIRAWNDMENSREIVPAVVLRARFDGSDVLTDWGFVDPLTGRALPVLETRADASRWFESLSHAPPPIPPRVELDQSLIRGKTKQLDVERILGQWRPDLHCGRGGPVPVVRKTRADSGSIWDWYADRPSPLFIPPRYLIATFDVTDALIVWHFERTYPGGRK